MRSNVPRIVTSLLLFSLCVGAADAREMSFVRQGHAESVRYEGAPWKPTGDSVEATGEGRRVFASLDLGPEDATVRARLRIDGLAESGAAFVVGGSHFGFEGGVGGEIFGDEPLTPGNPVVWDGETFDFEARRRGDQLSFWINGRRVWETVIRRGLALEDFGFRPRYSTMQIFDWSASGSLVEPPQERRPEFLVDIFQSGLGGVPEFRIPALVTTKKGTLLAFCEARRGGGGDTGNIDVALRRSEDGGMSWGTEQTVWSEGSNTCGNPCAVVDAKTGRVWLSICWNRAADGEMELIRLQNLRMRRVFMTYSDDDGKTWAPVRDISRSARRPDWRWYATGPGTAIQLTRGTYAGRIVFPANHSDHTPPLDKRFLDFDESYYRSHVFYSDDHGETWKLGGALDRNTNESTIVELSDGSILDNIRSYEEKGRRAVSVSRDGGDTWSPVTLHPELIEPKCQANLLRYSFPSDSEKSRILFCNPASPRSRTRMTVRVSYDEGETWPVGAMIYRGSAAYSCMTVLSDGAIGVFFERDNNTKISFAKFTLEWLEKSDG